MKEYLSNSAFTGKKLNAFLSSALIVYIFATATLLVSEGDLSWGVYAYSVFLLTVLPIFISRDFKNLVPFEILLLVSVPFTLRGLELGIVGSHTLNYLSAAAIALLLITELDAYTSFKTNRSFSVVLISLTTISIAGFWAVGRWLSDIYIGTSWITSEETLMWEFTAAALAGLVTSQLFTYYFRKREKQVMDLEN